MQAVHLFVLWPFRGHEVLHPRLDTALLVQSLYHLDQLVEMLQRHLLPLLNPYQQVGLLRVGKIWEAPPLWPVVRLPAYLEEVQLVILLPVGHVLLQGSRSHGEILPLYIPLAALPVLDQLSRHYLRLILFFLLRNLWSGDSLSIQG